MKMKPVPKFLLVGIVVVGLGYGVNTYLERRAAIQASAPVEVVIQPQAPAVVQVAPVQTPVVQAPVAEAPVVSSPNRGMDALLNAGKK
jgi:hypothetical protein